MPFLFSTLSSVIAVIVRAMNPSREIPASKTANDIKTPHVLWIFIGIDHCAKPVRRVVSVNIVKLFECAIIYDISQNLRSLLCRNPSAC